MKAAKQLGMKEVPTIVADDLNEEQIKAYRIADNKVSELAEWDFCKLDDELQEILNIDMSEFGFDTETFDIGDNEYEEQGLKENKTQLHKCPECGCEFED